MFDVMARDMELALPESTRLDARNVRVRLRQGRKGKARFDYTGPD